MRRRYFSCPTLLLVYFISLSGFRAAEAVPAKGDEAAAIARQAAAFELPADRRPDSWVVLRAGDLGAIFNRKEDGIELLSLFDLAKNRQLAAETPLPLFRAALLHLDKKNSITVSADGGWQRINVEETPGKETKFTWEGPVDERLGLPRATAVAALDAAAGAIRWKFQIDNVGERWAVRWVNVPQVALDASAEQFSSFHPTGPGLIKRGSWEGVMAGAYPSCSAPMQYMAAYDPRSESGLYFAMHDPRSAKKDLFLRSRPDKRDVALECNIPAEDMNAGGNGFVMPGEAVWQVLHGDWFDAALIYREWVRKNAPWRPKLGPDGREDTPRWMRELPVWLHASGAPEKVVSEVERFSEAMGVPVGVHWYNWHEIPFDNDYPHYFPVKEGFGAAVRRLQSKDIYVMPYINGRLWDSRDKGMDDFQFSRVALPAATKEEDGKPHLESYSSKESDGSKVRLAAMCPSTKLWQTKVRETALRLMNEYGVKGVYIDQLAMSGPVLCFDRSHGHPTGGGHWWAEGYNKMLESIRWSMPKDRMLTSEGNAEAYARNLDGFLTWHWCVDGQVPAFPAVYGGAVQMFGRSYRGGETKDLALRMKVGQQLVFGEQLGWISSWLLEDQRNMDFLRRAARLRWRLRRYFYAGEMARPPILLGDVPAVRADWQWSKPGWVTTDAVMAGAWTLPKERRAVILLTNVSDQPATVKPQIDASAYGVPGEQVRLKIIVADVEKEPFLSPSRVSREVSLPARSAQAWELTLVK
ncbi:MAG: hypothetical protein JW959_11960 [Pirellulales bacterium]|nr:hypothetical protein [Pirellulales bacterium]